MVFSADFILVWVLILTGLIVYGKVFKAKKVIEVERPKTLDFKIFTIITKHLDNADLSEWDKDYPSIPKHIINMLKEISPLLGDMDIAFMVKVEKRAHFKLDYVAFLTVELIYEYNNDKL